MAAAAQTSGIEDFLASAARRHTLVIAWQESLRVSCVLLGIAAAGLLLGTALVPLTVLGAAALAGISVIVVRTAQLRTGRYHLAQRIDAQLELQDALSTAWFLIDSKPRHTAPADHQLRSAAAIAEGVHPREVFPVRMGAFGRAAGVLLTLTALLLVMRLARTSSLGAIAFRNPAISLRWAAEPARALEHQLDSLKQVVAHTFTMPSKLFARSPEGAPAVPNREQGAAGDAASQNADRELADVQQKLNSEQQGSASSDAFQQMRDALHGLASKLTQAVRPAAESAQKSAQPAGEDNRGSDSSKNRSAAGDNAQSEAERRGSSGESPGKDSKTGGSSPTPPTQPQAVEKSHGAPLGSATQPAQEDASDAQSGAGRNDGRKDLRSADQLRAIGKLTEILGKRSAALTGEMTLDKSSANQHLQTQDTKEVREHNDRGDELHRDEIPPEYRDYIRAYMDAVHKQAAAQKQPAPSPEPH